MLGTPFWHLDCSMSKKRQDRKEYKSRSARCLSERGQRWPGPLSLALCDIVKCRLGTVNSSHLLAWNPESSPAGISTTLIKGVAGHGGIAARRSSPGQSHVWEMLGFGDTGKPDGSPRTQLPGFLCQRHGRLQFRKKY